MQNKKPIPIGGEPQSQVYRLGILDRFVLAKVLPPEGDISTLRIVRELRQALSFTEAEHKKFSMKIVGEGEARHWEWDNDVDRVNHKGIQVGPLGFTLIHDALKKLNEAKKLTEEHIGLYDMFCAEAKKE